MKNAGELIHTGTTEPLRDFSTLGPVSRILYSVLKRHLLVDETPIGLNIFGATVTQG